MTKEKIKNNLKAANQIGWFNLPSAIAAGLFILRTHLWNSWRNLNGIIR